jgi:hypothetical protein
VSFSVLGASCPRSRRPLSSAADVQGTQRRSSASWTGHPCQLAQTQRPCPRLTCASAVLTGGRRCRNAKICLARGHGQHTAPLRCALANSAQLSITECVVRATGFCTALAFAHRSANGLFGSCQRWRRCCDPPAHPSPCALAPPGDCARRARNADAGRARRRSAAARHATAAASADAASTASRRHASRPHRCVGGACVSPQALQDRHAQSESKRASVVKRKRTLLLHSLDNPRVLVQRGRGGEHLPDHHRVFTQQAVPRAIIRTSAQMQATQRKVYGSRASRCALAAWHEARNTHATQRVQRAGRTLQEVHEHERRHAVSKDGVELHSCAGVRGIHLVDDHLRHVQLRMHGSARASGGVCAASNAAA